MAGLPEFRIRYPEFESVGDSVVLLALGDASVQVDESRWQRFYEMGLMSLTAHLVSIRVDEMDSGGSVSSAGPAVTVIAGPLTVKQAVLPVSAELAQLSSTSYGLRYIELRRLVMPVGFSVFIADVPPTRQMRRV